MLLVPYSLALSCLLSIVELQAVAVPHPTFPQSIPLVRRARGQQNATEWLARQKSRLEGKYGVSQVTRSKRASGLNLLTNQGADSDFFGSVAVGTPPVSYNVVLDTGSADFWLAASNGVSTTEDGIPTFDSNSSSTFKDLKIPFEIQYGSGAAQGTLGQDVVQLAGFQVNSQTLAVATQVEQGTLSPPLSGIMGMAFATIASSGATPFWETLVQSEGTLNEPLMSFQLTRFIDVKNAQELEPGGTFTIGATNSSLFTGEIDYQPIPSGQETYWTQELTGLTVNGHTISLASGSDSFAAIDTGTTLVAGPQDAIEALYQQIPGSQALAQQQGYFSLPCNAQVNVTLKFGSSNIAWAISPEDIIVQQVGDTCIGGFFAIDTSGTSAPPWIVGDVFLKNVYSVFRANPAAVGFATLSSEANGLSALGNPPSPTVGVAATVSGGSGTIRSSNSNDATNLAFGTMMSWLFLLFTSVISGCLIL